MAGLQELARNNLTSQQSLDQVENEISLTCQEKTDWQSVWSGPGNSIMTI